MLKSTFDYVTASFQRLTTDPDQVTEANRSPNRSPKRYFSDLNPGGVPDPTPLNKRACRSPLSNEAADCSPASREQLGGKGMFLQRMKEAGFRVPPFECVTAHVVNALEQHPLDIRGLEHYFPGIGNEPEAEISLAIIRERLNAMPSSEQTKRDNWLAGLAQFVASDDYYAQVKDSEAARQIRHLRHKLDELSTSQPVIVRSSGINEDNYGDAQAGKYLSVVQEEDDILCTCLKVMASAYRPEVCCEGVPQPMALIIQQCIDCRFGGVAMSFKSFQDNTVSVEYTRGQPKGVVAGQSGNTPHRIDIFREDRKEEADSSQYFAGTISSHFTLHKSNNGYLEIRIDDANAQSNDGGQKLSDKMVATLRKVVTELENLLLCPVDVEFAIDRQGRLFLLQVRPITRLSGDMAFAMPIPKEALAIGESISEGYCTGPLWLANRREVDSMPEGAIVLADHAEDWMLESKFLNRAGGFVLTEAGFNDHVAILLKQEQIPLMRAGDHYSALASQEAGQQATLACARFNDEPGAFIVAGDLTGKLASHRSLSTAFSDLPSTKVIPSRDDLSPPEGTFRLVASGFQWLTDQNARLLAFFAPGGGLDCLANPIKLSMSPQRSKILAETEEIVQRLIHGAKAQLNGYGAFLRLAVNSDSQQLKSRLDELPQLMNRFVTLEQTIQSGLKAITLPSDDGKEGQVTFRQWVAACHQLQSCLQALNPTEAEQLRSVHDLIFALHQRFVNALAPVSLAAGQGRISREGSITYLDCTTLDENVSILRPPDRAFLEKTHRPATVVIMDNALIVNQKLGNHFCLIELLEYAEGGKERTLRLTFADEFDSPDGSDEPSKLKRMWFLVKLLKAIELDKNADSMKLSFNAVAGEIFVECSQISSRGTMQEAYEKLIIVLNAMYNLDRWLEHSVIFEGDQWNFDLLAQRLNRDIATEADRFAFRECLFAIAYDFCTIVPDFYSLLRKQHQQFINHVQCLSKCLSRELKDELREMFKSNEIGADIRRQLLQHLLFRYPPGAMQLVELLYSHLKGQFFVVKPSCSEYLKFYAPPGQLLGDHKEKVRNALLKHGLRYASQRVLNDKDLVLPALEKHPDQLKYVSEELRDDSDVVMASVRRAGTQIQYASLKLKDDYKQAMAAVVQDSGALAFVSERLRGDKNIIRVAIAESIYALSYASQKVLKDRQCMLDLIEINPRAFKYAASELKDDTAFIEAAKQRNPELRQYLR